ncbi:hypothetical protein PUG81_28785 [Erwiniaceae bacterium L1_54_6]|jgi:hypothetical protein|nr:hypothetical protein [Erwiniaceae bacterium L1_54_6]
MRTVNAVCVVMFFSLLSALPVSSSRAGDRSGQFTLRGEMKIPEGGYKVCIYGKNSIAAVMRQPVDDVCSAVMGDRPGKDGVILIIAQ